MTSNMTCFILLIVMLMSGFCLSQNIIPYYETEVFMDDAFGNREEGCREIVVPKEGEYYRFASFEVEDSHYRNIFATFDPNELDILIKLGTLRPSAFIMEYTNPVMIRQSEIRSDQGFNNIESLCILIQLGLDAPFLWPIGYLEDVNLEPIKLLYKLKHLKHLEVFDIPKDYLDLEKLPELSMLEYIGIPYDGSDDIIKAVTQLKRIEFINASFTKVTGSNFEQLANLPNLKILDLRYTSLSKGAISKLKHCKNLKTLLLTGSNVTDNHLQGLEDLVTLENLTLSSTQITSLSIKKIQKLPNLRFLTIGEIDLDNQVIQQLQKENPHLEMITKSPIGLWEGYKKEYLYQKATFGEIESQLKLFYKYYRTYERVENKVQSSNPDEYPYDKTEFLKWAYVLLSPRKSLTSTESLRNQKRLEKYGVEKIKNELEKNMLPIEIAEAHRRANTVLSLDRKYKVEPRIENYPYLPVYQWDFEFITDHKSLR